MENKNSTQTVTVSDEAVQAAEEAVYGRHERGFLMKPLINPVDMRKALQAALQHLALSAAPYSVEVKKLDWFKKANGDIVSDSAFGWFRLHTVVANTCFRLETPDGFIEYLLPYSHWPESDAKAAAQADFEHRILSQIDTKPVDVAAVRDASFRQGLLVAANSCDRWADDLAGLVDSVEHHLRSKATAIRALSPAEPVDNEDEYDIHTYRELAAAAIEDLKNYAKDGDGSRLMVSHNSYLEDLARIDRAAPTSKGGE